jgi:hypothetical protein
VMRLFLATQPAAAIPRLALWRSKSIRRANTIPHWALEPATTWTRAITTSISATSARLARVTPFASEET